MLPLLDKLGGPETDPHYPMGWAMAGNAPLKRWQEDDIWELYHTDRDFSQAYDLAGQNPAKLKELQDLGVLQDAASSGQKDIVDTAAEAGSFNTLVTAVKAAGLVDTLKGKGPFTVFAPTDAAFAKLPAGTLEALLKLRTTSPYPFARRTGWSWWSWSTPPG